MPEESTTNHQPESTRRPPTYWDKLQPDLLVFLMGAILSIFVGLRIFNVVGIDGAPNWFFPSLFACVALALTVWKLRAGTPAAAALGAFICLSLLIRQYLVPGWTKTALPELLLLFVLTFAATRFGRARKRTLGFVETRERRGRVAAQVMANLGVAGFLGFQASPILFTACLAALAEATADTVSSELGQLLGGRTLLITTGRQVPPGTDGGISLPGTLAGIASAALIPLLALLCGAINLRLALVVFVCGAAGLLFDSLLGATVERWRWIGNDLVNFASTFFAAWLAAKIALLVQPPLVFW